MTKTACYVDGFNLYHAIDALGIPRLKWVDLRLLAQSLAGESNEVSYVVYFTSEMTWEPEKLKRHRLYIKALRTVGVEPVIAKFLTTEKHCQRYDRFCKFKEEKQTDVSFAVRIITDCLTNGVERVILVTADSDQVPTVAAIRELASQVEIIVACPPGRRSIARELTKVAHDSMEILPGRIDRCLFPRNVRNERGVVVAQCPARYEHPEAQK